jgi:hypothetical protein
MGNGNTIIGPTDSRGNTIINRGGTAIGNGATADPTSIAIGAGAHAGGGINIQQRTAGDNSPIINSPITVGDIPKSISPQDLKTLTTYFSRCQNKATVQVTADQFSGVTPFPEQYYGALKGAGWTMLEDGVNQYMGFAAPGKRFQGAMIRVKGEPLKPQEKASFEPSDPVACIGNSIEAFQIPTTLNRDHNQRDGVITVDFQGGFPH